MNKSLKILGAIAALAAIIGLTVRAPAQFLPGPTVRQMLTNDTSGANVFVLLPGPAPGPATNLNGLAVRNVVPIGPGGCGILVNCAGTNATTTTNLTITFEFSPDGVNWTTNDRLSIVVTPLGVGYAPVYSNMFTASLYGSAFGNVTAARIASMQHSNTGSIFITNIAMTSR